MLLKGKVALITGAREASGKATALVMAHEGADVAVADVLPEIEVTAQEVETLGRRSTAVTFDIADHEQVHDGVNKIVQDLGAIDILVNNAGIVNNIAWLTRMTHEAWTREISVNLSGAFNMIKAVIGPMIEKKWGRIINISSLAATGGLHKQAGYTGQQSRSHRPYQDCRLGTCQRRDHLQRDTPRTYRNRAGRSNARRNQDRGSFFHTGAKVGFDGGGRSSRCILGFRQSRLHQWRRDSHQRGAGTKRDHPGKPQGNQGNGWVICPWEGWSYWTRQSRARG